MKISRNLAITILKHLHKHPKFYFPFLVVCKEYSIEDKDFVEIEPKEWKNIQDDEIYQTFELWENLQHLHKDTTALLAKWFIDKITNSSIKEEIKSFHKQYKKLYKQQLPESAKIEEYETNEFYLWKADAFEEALEIIKKYTK